MTGEWGLAGVDVSHEGAHSVVALVCELDVYSAFQLRDVLVELERAGRHHIAVDMSKLEFMDSTGLGVLLGGMKRAKGAGGGLCIVGACERVLKTFRITGLVRVIPAYATLDEALAWLDSPRDAR